MSYAWGVQSPFLALARVTRELSVLAAATPTNASEERARLCRAFEAGGEACPRWVYFAHDARAHRRAVREALVEIERRGDPLIELVRGRCEELLLECDAVEAVGGPHLSRFAERRFGRAEPWVARAALATATAGIARPPAERRRRLEASDAVTRTSLFGRVRAEVARLGLPFDVETSPRLCALAATGERTIWVAEGRAIPARIARRTALHEVHGHALPRVRARAMPHAIFAIGTASGADDQEGLALELERRAGFLDAERLFELGARHLAALSMSKGATFVETVRGLRAAGVKVSLAVLAAERAFRGSDGRSAGLGRERVYLEAHARVRAHFERAPLDEAILASGQIAVSAVPHLAAARGGIGSRSAEPGRLRCPSRSAATPLSRSRGSGAPSA